MSFRILFGLVATIVLLDQIGARLADQRVREMNPTGIPVSMALPSSDALGPRSRITCSNESIYLIYRYQFCFVPYTPGPTEGDDGWHVVYHKPKPRLSIIMPATRPDSYYFQEIVQGEFILFIKRDGEIVLGDQR